MGVQATSEEARRANPSLQTLPFKFLDGPMTHHLSLATYPVSFLAILTPWWLPMLDHFSQSCALVLPILGVGWLILQVCWGIWDRRKKP
jgi:hypothetical protein